MLWDKTCSGNKSEAMAKFFNSTGTMYHLVYNPCEWVEHRDTPWCLPWRAPDSINTKLKRWMRQPDCLTSFGEWHTKHPESSSWSYADWQFSTAVPETFDWASVKDPPSTLGCCDTCQIQGGNVDVYYWPVPDTNSDCLGIIGTSYKSPDDGMFGTDGRGHAVYKTHSNPWTGETLQPSTTAPNVITPAPPHPLRARTRIPLNASVSTNGSSLWSVDIKNGFTLQVSTVDGAGTC